MTPVGVEPTIPGMKTLCPRPLDDGAIYRVDTALLYRKLPLQANITDLNSC